MTNDEQRRVVTVEAGQEQDGELETTAAHYPARYIFTKERISILYNDIIDDGEGGITVPTRVDVSDGSVEIKRRGMMSLHLRRGETFTDEYTTPVGTIDIEYTATEVEYSLDAEGGALTLIYSLKLGGAPLNNRIDISVTRG